MMNLQTLKARKQTFETGCHEVECISVKDIETFEAGLRQRLDTMLGLLSYERGIRDTLKEMLGVV